MEFARTENEVEKRRQKEEKNGWWSGGGWPKWVVGMEEMRDFLFS